MSGVEKGRARDGVALLLSEWMVNKVVEWKEVSSRLMWVRLRMGRECWAFVSAYRPGCERSEEEREEFRNELTRCVDGLSTRNYIVVLGDLNARVGDGELEGVVGKYGVSGENETGSRSPCMRPRSDPPKMKNSNVVRIRLIILINEEINEANWMVSNSAKLDHRTKQHTQFRGLCE